MAYAMIAGLLNIAVGEPDVFPRPHVRIAEIVIPQNADVENLIEPVEGVHDRVPELPDGGGDRAHQLSADFDPARQNRVVLLSDGVPTAGISATGSILDMSRVYNSDGIGLTSIGLGADFNIELMRGLALQADGNFYFLEDPGAVDEVFIEELNYFTVPVAFDLKIDVRAGENYRFGRALGSPLWRDHEGGGSLAVPSVFIAHRHSDTDVTEAGQLQALADATVERFGRIDVLINDAGVIQVGPVEHMQVDDFMNAMAIHAWGPLYGMLAARPHMREQGGGRIVNVSTLGTRDPFPGFFAYAAAKAATNLMTRVLDEEARPLGLRAEQFGEGLTRAFAHIRLGLFERPRPMAELGEGHLQRVVDRRPAVDQRVVPVEQQTGRLLVVPRPEAHAALR